MGSNIKLAAERLLKIADELEKEASNNTFFVCDTCNHTSSLADINTKRKLAGEAYKVKRVASVSVNDEVSCLACGGKMSYVPTESSQKYYVESEDTGADIFEPVDEQDKDKTEDTPVMGETPEGDTQVPAVENTPAVTDAPAIEDKTNEMPPSDETPTDGDKPAEGLEISDYDTPEGETPEEGTNPEDSTPEDSTPEEDKVPTEENIEDKTPGIDEGIPGNDEPPAVGEGAPEGEDPVMGEGTPDSDAPDMGEGKPEGEDPITEETVPGEDVPGETSEVVPGDEEDQAEEDGVSIPKKDVPKFEKMPKEAQDAFWRLVAKYSI